MGFKIPQGANVAPTAKLMLANAADVKLVPVQGHGPTSLFKLLMGTTQSTRDKLPAANQMVSLFIMDFAPGGTNIPHHHDTAEEIYYITSSRVMEKWWRAEAPMGTRGDTRPKRETLISSG